MRARKGSAVETRQRAQATCDTHRGLDARVVLDDAAKVQLKPRLPLGLLRELRLEQVDELGGSRRARYRVPHANGEVARRVSLAGLAIRAVRAIRAEREHPKVRRREEEVGVLQSARSAGVGARHVSELVDLALKKLGLLPSRSLPSRSLA